MTKLKTFNHVAAGVSQSFISRNNDVGGYWALGELYKDASAPDDAVQLQLLDGVAIPSTRSVCQVAKNYAVFLQRALADKGIASDELADANVCIQFNAEAPEGAISMEYQGDPFVCTVTLRTAQGKVAVAKAYGRCLRNRWGMFAGRAG
ncbi:hypothetical protein CR152_08525 [Massilia violaceinigra]|uniref:Uncharacterized protein n=1 Tax=Massilia violaceinigra TaxID=2045208 RepID=A0A2D2DHV1_9BURK|nr:hypothetical protein [Massilia violaceinigra]ATQ74558.1 hypothetical protein CR152_08525 [Massilia violaceinigra]